MLQHLWRAGLGGQREQFRLPTGAATRTLGVYDVQVDKDNPVHLVRSTEYRGCRSRRVRGPAREGLGGQEPPLQRGGEWESLDFTINGNILRSYIRVYGEELRGLPCALCARGSLPHATEAGAAPGLWLGRLGHSQAQCCLCGLHQGPRLQTEEPAHFLLKCPSGPAGNHIRRKITLTGCQGPGLDKITGWPAVGDVARRCKTSYRGNILFFYPFYSSPCNAKDKSSWDWGQWRYAQQGAQPLTPRFLWQKRSTLMSVKLTHLFD